MSSLKLGARVLVSTKDRLHDLGPGTYLGDRLANAVGFEWQGTAAILLDSGRMIYGFECDVIGSTNEPIAPFTLRSPVKMRAFRCNDERVICLASVGFGVNTCFQIQEVAVRKYNGTDVVLLLFSRSESFYLLASDISFPLYRQVTFSSQ